MAEKKDGFSEIGDQAHKGAHLMDIFWSIPVSNGSDLGWVNLNAISSHKVSKEFYFLLLKFTFLELDVIFVFMQEVKSSFDMLLVFLNCFAKNEDVINVHHHKLV